MSSCFIRTDEVGCCPSGWTNIKNIGALSVLSIGCGSVLFECDCGSVLFNIGSRLLGFMSSQDMTNSSLAPAPCVSGINILDPTDASDRSKPPVWHQVAYASDMLDNSVFALELISLFKSVFALELFVKLESVFALELFVTLESVFALELFVSL